jgi:DHA3 family macrolide efflux protein-like MFS transporter
MPSRLSSFWLGRLNVGESFLYFLISSALGTVALHCVRFSVAWLAMRETGSAVAFAVIFSTSSLVEVYSKPMLAPMADYFDRLKVYRACVGVSSITVLVLIVFITLLQFSISILTGLLIVLSLIAGLRDPTCAGLVPTLVIVDRLTSSQSLRSTANSITGLAAPMIGALLLAAGGVSVALTGAAVAAGLALISTFGILLLRNEVTAPP